MKCSKPVFKDMNLWLRKKLLFRKSLEKLQITSYKFDNPYLTKAALTNRMKKAHNFTKTTTKNDFMDISTNNELHNNDTNIEIDKLEVKNSFMLEHAKEQE